MRTTDVTAGLTNAQREAVTTTTGPLLVIAGPGTGKTKTLTARIVYLLQQGVARPDELLALTFTNKAAREMHERVSAQLPGGRLPLVVTFHALVNRLLPEEQGLRLATAHELADITKHVKRSCKPSAMGERDIALAISKAKNGSDLQDDSAMPLLAAYNAALAGAGLFDFDDMLLRLRDYLTTNTSPFTHVLVDEFQDTNGLQYDILRLLAPHGNIMAIGDPLQSIYGFRGASAAVFDRFAHDWPQTKTIRLDTNYRSTPQVVAATAALFPDEPALAPHRTDTGSVHIIETLNEYGEAGLVVREIERQLGGSTMLAGSEHHATAKPRTFRDFAILYRTHASARTIQLALEESGLPYQVAGEGSPYLHPDMAAIAQAMCYLTEQGDAPTTKALSASQAGQLLDHSRERLVRQPLAGLPQSVAALLGIATEKNAALLRQFSNSLLRRPDLTLDQFGPYMAELADQEYYDPAAEAISLMTMHAAKGLEFSQVFVICVEEGITPLAKHGQITDLAEERRLFYVAVTRARDDLYLLHCRTRAREPRELSRFAVALPRNLAVRSADPAMAAQTARNIRRAQKRSQGTLF